MIKLKTNMITTMLILSMGSATAVNINPKGIGEVLIFPYYTVNNEFNTFYSVVNTTNQVKAIKVRFLEGENNQEVLTFNVYLSPYDVWTGHLSATSSTLAGHAGELSGLHLSTDNSCAPFLNNQGQEFLPYVIDLDVFIYPNGNSNLERSTHGYIEVIDMGTVTGDSAEAATHNSNGIPDDCEQLEQAWAFDDSYWSINPLQDLTAPIGGLTGSATLLNVSEGNAMSYDALALENFWDNNPIAHSSPGSLLPNLNAAATESQVVHNNQLITSNWSTGAEAVTAVLMQHQLFNQYDLFSAINAKTEWVVSFPTKNFHVTQSFGIDPIPPFNATWNGIEACESSTAMVWDEAQLNSPSVPLDLCFGINTIEFLQAGDTTNGTSAILGSNNLTSIHTLDDGNATDAGWMKLSFNDSTQIMNSGNNISYLGLPALGFMVNRYTNANAPVGVLAQYSNLINHTTQRNIQADLIFMDNFE